MDKILSVQNVSKSFMFEGRKVLVLKDISFEVFDQEFVSIIGPSGCGKSTMLELIAGITVPDGGKIYKHGSDITGRTGNSGYMPQDDLLFPWLTIIKNAVLPSRIKKRNLDLARNKAISLLPDFGLDGFGDYLPFQLSGGMKQRAAFLRSVMCEEEILLLDEPFAKLDALTRLQLQNWLLELKNKLKQTIVFVTHDIDEAIRLSNTIYVMDKSPAPFIHVEKVPSELHDKDNQNSQVICNRIKKELTSKLIKP